METQAVAGIQQMREMINNGKNRTGVCTVFY